MSEGLAKSALGIRGEREFEDLRRRTEFFVTSVPPSELDGTDCCAGDDGSSAFSGGGLRLCSAEENEAVAASSAVGGGDGRCARLCASLTDVDTMRAASLRTLTISSTCPCFSPPAERPELRRARASGREKEMRGGDCRGTDASVGVERGEGGRGISAPVRESAFGGRGRCSSIQSAASSSGSVNSIFAS